MNSSKRGFRKKILGLRDSQTKKVLERKSLNICKKLLKLKEVKNAKQAGLYNSISNEVNTSYLINELKKRGLEIFLPKNLENGQNYVYASFLDWKSLKIGVYGVLEPGEGKFIETDNLDFIVVPGIAFDINGTRLGFGKGIYDRLLKNYQGIKIGLAFDFQITDVLPRDVWDVPMDMVITEKRVIEVKR